MTIKKKDLWDWINNKTIIRYRGEIYRAEYNGLRYLIRPILGGDCIDFYKKSRGVYGLVTNKS